MPQRPLQMIKKQFSLHPKAFDWLTLEAARIGVSVSEFLRRVVDTARERNKTTRR